MAERNSSHKRSHHIGTGEWLLTAMRYRPGCILTEHLREVGHLGHDWVKAEDMPRGAKSFEFQGIDCVLFVTQRQRRNNFKLDPMAQSCKD